MKYILLFLLLSLSACGIPFIGGDDSEVTSEEIASATKDFTTDDVSLSIPSNWTEVIESSLPVPKTGKVLLALKSNDQEDGIYKSLIILEDKIIGNLSSEQYSRNDYAISIKNYFGHKKLSEKSFNFADGDTSNIYSFEAKYNPDSPRMRFVQTSRICRIDDINKVYNMTIALPPSIEDLEKYELLLATFTCSTKTAED